MPQAVRRVQELRNWNRLNNGSCLLEENEICPPVTENLHSTLTAHYKEKVSETQQLQGAQLEKAINSDSSTRLIFQSISAFAQTPAISLRAAARAGTSSSAAAGQQEACLCSSQRSSTSLEENRNIHQTQLAPMTTTIILIDMIEILASGSQLCFWKGDPCSQTQLGHSQREGCPKHTQRGSRRLLPSAMKCSGTWSVTLTVSGQDSWEPQTTARTQELTAIRVSAVLFTGLFMEPARHTEGRVGGQKVKLHPGLSQQRRESPGTGKAGIENRDGSSAGVCTPHDSHRSLLGTGIHFARGGRKPAQSPVQTLSLGTSPPWNHSSHLPCSPAETTITSCQHWLAWQPPVKPSWSRTALGWLNHRQLQLGGTETPSFTGNGVKPCNTESSREAWLPQKIQLLLLDADWQCQVSK